jgi:hypothetical protein
MEEQIMTVALSTGPVLAAEERGVHIIFVSEDTVPCGSPGNPTEQELKLVAQPQYIGFPAPTDIIVFCGLPWHFAGGKLKKHPDVHTSNPETVLKLDRRTRDRPVWWSEMPFTITKIEKENPKDPTLAASPFPVAPVTSDTDTIGLFVARSPVPTSNAYGQGYKITFTMNGSTIDPNMDCVNN